MKEPSFANTFFFWLALIAAGALQASKCVSLLQHNATAHRHKNSALSAHFPTMFVQALNSTTGLFEWRHEDDSEDSSAEDDTINDHIAEASSHEVM